MQAQRTGRGGRKVSRFKGKRLSMIGLFGMFTQSSHHRIRPLLRYFKNHLSYQEKLCSEVDSIAKVILKAVIKVEGALDSKDVLELEKVYVE